MSSIFDISYTNTANITEASYNDYKVDISAAFAKWDTVISGFSNANLDGDKISITVDIKTLAPNTLGSASITEIYQRSDTGG